MFTGAKLGYCMLVWFNFRLFALTIHFFNYLILELLPAIFNNVDYFAKTNLIYFITQSRVSGSLESLADQNFQNSFSFSRPVRNLPTQDWWIQIQLLESWGLAPKRTSMIGWLLQISLWSVGNMSRHTLAQWTHSFSKAILPLRRHDCDSIKENSDSLNSWRSWDDQPIRFSRIEAISFQSVADSMPVEDVVTIYW
jgi:hypothetical protein